MPPFKGSGPLMNLIGLSPVLAILAGIRIHRPASKLPWLLLAAGSALFWLGDLYTYSYPHLLGADVPFPSPGDALYVAMYPVMMAGLLLLVRRRNAGRDRNGLIDGLILTVGLSLPAWIALMAPYVHMDDLSLLGKMVSVAYPVGDVILVGAVVRLALDAGRREPAFYLLTASIVLLLITDFAYGLLTLHGLYDHQLWLDAGWIGSYLLWGAAGLHPSMARLDQPVPGREVVLTRFRLALLTCASLMAPVIGIVHDIRTGDLDYTAVRAASIVLFGLVVVRMAGLVRQQERSLERERVLSGAGAELVAATEREEIDRVAVRAAASLVAPGAAVALCRIGEGRALRLAASDGWDATTGEGLEHLAIAADRDEAVMRLAVTRGRRPRACRPRIPASGRRARAPPRRGGGHADRRGDDRLEGGARRHPCARHPGRARPRQRRAQRGSAPAARRGALQVARPPRQRPHHRPRAGHDGQLSEPVDRARPRLPSPRCPRAAVRPPRRSRRSRSPRALRRRHGGRRAGAASGVRAQSRNGESRQFEILFTNLIEDEHVGGILLNARDVSERKAFEAELAHQAFHDPVTGLANRAMFAEQVRQAIARARREGRTPAVIFLDLDDFKTVNDSLGHAAGDEVLVEFARRLDDSVRGADVAARFGGDEFAVLLEDVAREPGRGRRRTADPRAARPADAGGSSAGDAERQHRHLDLRPGGHPRRRRADPRRRRRDVHRQARRQERLPAVRARDARGRASHASSSATTFSARSPPTSSSCTTSP